MEEGSISEASQVELVSQIALQPLDSLRVCRRLRRRAPLLEQLIHPRIAVACEVEWGGRLENQRQVPKGQSREIPPPHLKLGLSGGACHASAPDPDLGLHL